MIFTPESLNEDSIYNRADVTESEHLPSLTNKILKSLERFPAMTSDAVVAEARAATQASSNTHLVRGACAYELLGRVEALSGGRAKKDENREGKRARFADLAAQIGVHPKTLENDFRIFEIFFAEAYETRSLKAPSLPRAFYLTALEAADPHEAIRIAGGVDGMKMKISEFRSYLRSTQLREVEDGEAKSKPAEFYRFSTKLPASAEGLIFDLKQQTGQSRNDIIYAALVRFRAEVVSHEQRPEATTRLKLELPGVEVINNERPISVKPTLAKPTLVIHPGGTPDQPTLY